MSGFCSAHQDHVVGCPQCESIKRTGMAYLAASNQAKQKLEPMKNAFKAVALEDIKSILQLRRRQNCSHCQRREVGSSENGVEKVRWASAP